MNPDLRGASRPLDLRSFGSTPGLRHRSSLISLFLIALLVGGCGAPPRPAATQVPPTIPSTPTEVPPTPTVRPSPTAAPTATTTCVNCTVRAVAPTAFGVLLPFDGQAPTPDKAALATLGAKATAIWLYVPRFYSPATGGVNAAAIAQLVEQAAAATGLDIYVHLMSGTGQGGKTQMPNLDGYLPQIADIARALQGKVEAYSVEDEISPYTWEGSPDDYTRLLQAVYATIKEIDPDVIVADSGMAGLTYGIELARDLERDGERDQAIALVNDYYQYNEGPIKQWLPIRDQAGLDALLSDPTMTALLGFSAARFRQACASYDALQLHFYQSSQYLPQVFEWIRRQMDANNCVKPIQVWGIGYGIDQGFGTDEGALPYAPLEHAAATSRLLTIAAAKGATLVLYDGYYDSGGAVRGLYTPEGEALPAAKAFNLTVSRLSGFTLAEDKSDGTGLWLFRFVRPQGEAYVAWASEPRAIDLPAAHVSMTDLADSVTHVPGSAIPVGTEPVFLEPE